MANGQQSRCSRTELTAPLDYALCYAAQERYVLGTCHIAKRDETQFKPCM